MLDIHLFGFVWNQNLFFRFLNFYKGTTLLTVNVVPGVFNGAENCDALDFPLVDALSYTIQPTNNTGYISFQCGYQDWTGRIDRMWIHRFVGSTHNPQRPIVLKNFEYKNNVRHIIKNIFLLTIFLTFYLYFVCVCVFFFFL